MRTSHSSSSTGGRAFSAGNDPTTPALHCAITRSGTEIMNSGAPITGIDSRPLNTPGMDMREIPLARYRDGQDSQLIDARHHTKKATAPWVAALLAQRAGDVIVSAAIVRLSRSAGDQYFRRAGLGSIDIEAPALLESLCLTKLISTKLAVR